MWCPIENDNCDTYCAFWDAERSCCLIARAAKEIPKELKKLEEALKKK